MIISKELSNCDSIHTIPLTFFLEPLLRNQIVSCSHLGVCDGQGINPDPPTSPLVFDGVVEQDPKDVINHLSYFLLLWVLGVDVSQGEHPVLPHGALQQAAGTKTQSVSRAETQASHRSMITNVNACGGWVNAYRRFSRLLLKSFIMSERKSLLTSMSSALGEEFFSRVATTFKITGWGGQNQTAERGAERKREIRETKMCEWSFGLDI